jgi:SAM-dependent methyltransferase
MSEKIYDYNNIKLNIGSSDRTKEGFVNLDIIAKQGVDIVCDLNDGIPLKDNVVTEVYAGHVLEHVDDIVKIMEEIYRVCRAGAIIKIKVPYFKSIGAFKDPTHRRFFTEETFYYFSRDKMRERNLPDYNIRANFEILKISYIWSSPLIRFLPFKKKFFIKHFWNIARTIYFELKVLK